MKKATFILNNDNLYLVQFDEYNNISKYSIIKYLIKNGSIKSEDEVKRIEKIEIDLWNKKITFKWTEEKEIYIVGNDKPYYEFTTSEWNRYSKYELMDIFNKNFHQNLEDGEEKRVLNPKLTKKQMIEEIIEYFN